MRIRLVNLCVASCSILLIIFVVSNPSPVIGRTAPPIRPQQDSVQPSAVIDPNHPQIPARRVVTYGFRDGQRDTYESWGAFDKVTVVEGMTKTASFVDNLRQRGILFAYHVPVNDHDKAAVQTLKKCAAGDTATCGQQIADLLTKPYSNTLNGALPGGFDAISWDELAPDEDSRVATQVQIAAIKAIKARYPNKLFLAFAWMYEFDNAGTFFQTIRDNVDLFLPERYFRESADGISQLEPKLHRTVSQALNFTADYLENTAPGILAKSVFALDLSSNEWFRQIDRDLNCDYKDFLDEQFHILRNSENPAKTKGVAFYPGLRESRSDIWLWAMQLVKHYYYDGATTYLGNGSFNRPLVKNPLFSQWVTDTVRMTNTLKSWVTTVGVDGNVFAKSGDHFYTPKNVYVPHSWLGPVPKMQRGSTPNAISQIVTVKANTGYRLMTYAKNDSGPTYTVARGNVYVTNPAGVSLVTAYRKLGSWLAPSWVGVPAKNGLYAKFFVEFNSGSNTQVKIVLTDDDATPGDSIWWDYVDLEESHGVPLVTAPARPASNLSWAAESGQITAPFRTEYGYLVQDTDTLDPSLAGKAVYSFALPTAGSYVVKAQTHIDGYRKGDYSFFMNIDADPDKSNVWRVLSVGSKFDIWPSNNFWTQTVSWDKGGAPKVFNLSAGNHQLIVKGRDSGVFIDYLWLEPPGLGSSVQ
jgi:hypothetical protein